MWQDQQCELLIELDGGISLISGSDSQVLWHHSFEDIRSSGDDGQYLWLDFGPSTGEKVGATTTGSTVDKLQCLVSPHR